MFCIPVTLPAETFQDNIVIVLDASGSMSEQMAGGVKMNVAKEALANVLESLPPGTNIGLLVFSAGNCQDWIYDLGPVEPSRLREAVYLPRPHGNTPLGAYIKKGADRLLEQRELQNGYGSFRLLVVTDGEATDSDLMKRYVPEVLSRGIIMDVIGVNMKQKHMLSQSAHSYRSADDPETLKAAIKDVLAEIGSGQDTAVMEEAFAAISPLPVEMAGEIIRALASSGNEPIGVKKSVKVQTPASGQAKVQPAPAHRPAKKKESKGMRALFKLVVVAMIFLIIAKVGGARK
ncbi:MAG: VWA domain-containing protein [Candidatus Wallbacteria bacterium]|nr:VWA domain-containing protein [Candidatus Wallbacteria bacterium]